MDLHKDFFPELRRLTIKLNWTIKESSDYFVKRRYLTNCCCSLNFSTEQWITNKWGCIVLNTKTTRRWRIIEQDRVVTRKWTEDLTYEQPMVLGWSAYADKWRSFIFLAASTPYSRTNRSFLLQIRQEGSWHVAVQSQHRIDLIKMQSEKELP